MMSPDTLREHDLRLRLRLARSRLRKAERDYRRAAQLVRQRSASAPTTIFVAGLVTIPFALPIAIIAWILVALHSSLCPPVPVRVAIAVGGLLLVDLAVLGVVLYRRRRFLRARE